MTHVFISCVEENARLGSWFADQMRTNGLDPWFFKDPDRISPGDQWKQVLASAIREGGYYVPIFTDEWSARERSVANEELVWAVDEARQRGLHRKWIVPVKASNAPLPAMNLGAGLTLNDLHYADIPTLGWERGLDSLLKALGVDRPVLEKGEPIATGFGSTLQIVGGFVTYRNTNPKIDELEGVTFTVTGGWARRNESGEIFANFKLHAPFEMLQQINEQFGFDSIDVTTGDEMISTDPDHLTHFYFFDEKDTQPPGSPLWEMGRSEPLRTRVELDQRTGYNAYGYLNAQDQIVGKFDGFVESSSQIGSTRFEFDGDFKLTIRSVIAPPALA